MQSLKCVLTLKLNYVRVCSSYSQGWSEVVSNAIFALVFVALASLQADRQPINRNVAKRWAAANYGGQFAVPLV